MKTFLKAVILVPIAILAVAFAVANRQVVAVSFDPFAVAEPTFAVVAPMFLLIFLLLMAGVVIGGAAAWLGQSHYRRAARRAQTEIDDLYGEIERLKTELAIQARQITDFRPKALTGAMADYDA